MYGDISQDLLAKKRAEVKEMTYNPSLLINVLFTAIKRYMDTAELASAHILQMQCTNITYVILKRAATFSYYLLKWDIRPPIQKTWIQFKVNFRQAI